MPRIERSIAYTFDAYAGETSDSNGKFKESVMKPHKTLRRGRTSTSSQKIQSHETMPKAQDEATEIACIVSQEAHAKKSFQESEPVQVGIKNSCFLILA